MNSLLEHAEALEREAASERVSYFEQFGVTGPTILDVGCGNGYSVSCWNARGLVAIGVDRSLYRLTRWLQEHPGRKPFVVADARALPFRSGLFANVLASGLIEHVGVRESSAPYRVRPLPAKREARAATVRELVRVTRPRGSCLLDFPNGAFPVDFWHGDRVGAFRLHRIPDTLNPSFAELRSYLPRQALELLPLRNRLRFRQISGRWWGRVLSRPVRATIWILDRLPQRLAQPIRAIAYPFLVVRVAA
jgi:SAM-dependent methyltransferase